MGMSVFAWLGAMAIGVSLGLLGSGGSILTVPVLVYLVGQEEKLAIAGSLAIVGFTLASFDERGTSRRRYKRIFQCSFVGLVIAW